MTEERPYRQKLTRALSNHICSRWYRPPEIILLEKSYDQSIDIWSLGCVFYELLFIAQMNKLLKQDLNLGNRPQDKRVLFPGNSCFPLSADYSVLDASDVD